MSSRARKRIPYEVADDILYQADHTCCMCQRENDVQLHHINPRKNNRPNNLIPLCPNCHSKVERKGGLGRKYSAGELERIRDDWFKSVRRRRQRAEATKNRTEFTAIAAFEARRISYEIEREPRLRTNWSRIKECLIRLVPLARDFEYDVKSEVTYAAAITSDRTRNGMPASVARTLAAVLGEILPIAEGGLRAPSRREITEQDKNLVLCVAEVAHSIAWDGCRYLRNPKIVEEGAHVLYTALRFAHLNRLDDIK